MNSQIQQEINQRIEGFVSEITELARKAAYETLSSALGHGMSDQIGSRHAGLSTSSVLRYRKGGKRSANEIAATADSLLQYIRDQPGQRMEIIAKAMDVSTKELTLPIKKLLQAKKIRVEGQKRATTYYIASGDAAAGSKATRTKQRRPGKKAR
jgi:hypothetical protein